MSFTMPRTPKCIHIQCTVDAYIFVEIYFRLLPPPTPYPFI